MGVVLLTGSLIAGPPGCGLGNFPASQFQDGLLFGVAGSQGKPYTYSADSTSRMINSPSAFLPIPGIGVNADVQRVDTLYWKCDAPVILLLSQDDGTGRPVGPVGGGVVSYNANQSKVPVSGLMVSEFPEQNALLALAVKGSARITFFAAGLQ